MPKYIVTAPDGKEYEINAPDGATPDQVIEFAKQNYSSTSKPEKPAVMSLGESIRDIPRQVGLTARAGVSGLTDVADLLATPFRAGLSAITGQDIAPVGEGVSNLLGLPQPQNATERTVQSAARATAGAMTPVGLARLVKPITDTARGFQSMLTANPILQGVSGGAAGGAMQSVAEAGGGPLEQAGAAILGGIAAPMAASKIGQTGQRVGQAVQQLTRPAQAPNIDIQINTILRNSGIELKDLPITAQNQLRQEVSQAMNIDGTLSPAAIRRLAEYRLVGATPTRGTLSLDPAIVTQQKNAAKRGAGSTDPRAQQLSQLENQNNQVLLNRLNEMGAERAIDPFAAGEDIASRLQGFADQQKQQIGQLYTQARDSTGRAAELESSVFAQNVGKTLDKELKTAFLPAEIKSYVNDISTGKLPLTVDVAEQLKTILATSQRGASDGNVRAALGIVREQLENTPLRSGAGQEAVQAFNQARKAARQFKQMQESNPLLKRVADGEIQPDKLFEDLIARQPASVLEKTLPLLGGEGKEVLRRQTIAYLKDIATSQRPDDMARVSGVQMEKAIRRLGSKKLDLLFTKQEQAQLQSLANVAGYEQFQPVGSAVNNSNTAAALSSMIERLAGSSVLGKLPLGMLIQEPVKNIAAGRAANQALNPLAALAMPAQRPLGLGVTPTLPGILDDQ